MGNIKADKKIKVSEETLNSELKDKSYQNENTTVLNSVIDNSINEEPSSNELYEDTKVLDENFGGTKVLNDGVEIEKNNYPIDDSFYSNTTVLEEGKVDTTVLDSDKLENTFADYKHQQSDEIWSDKAIRLLKVFYFVSIFNEFILMWQFIDNWLYEGLGYIGIIVTSPCLWINIILVILFIFKKNQVTAWLISAFSGINIVLILFTFVKWFFCKESVFQIITMILFLLEAILVQKIVNDNNKNNKKI